MCRAHGAGTEKRDKIRGWIDVPGMQVRCERARRADLPYWAVELPRQIHDTEPGRGCCGERWV